MKVVKAVAIILLYLLALVGIIATIALIYYYPVIDRVYVRPCYYYPNAFSDCN